MKVLERIVESTTFMVDWVLRTGLGTAATAVARAIAIISASLSIDCMVNKGTEFEWTGQRTSQFYIWASASPNALVMSMTGRSTQGS